jgi:small subunit ribosomal protein S4
LVGEGDTVTFPDKTADHEYMKALLEASKNKTVPEWLEVDWEKNEGKVVSLPTPQDITFPVEVHLVVELYSK